MFAVIPVLVAGLILMSDEPALGIGFALGALVSGIAYCALFAFLSVMNRHAVVIGLIYLLIWEGLLGGLLGRRPLAERDPLGSGADRADRRRRAGRPRRRCTPPSPPPR